MLRRALRWTLALAVVAVVAWLGRGVWQSGRVDRAINDGLALLSQAGTRDEARVLLEKWAQRTEESWSARREETIDKLYALRPADDPRVRSMLAWVGDVDFGTRGDDWKRWYENHCRLRDGRGPRTPPRQAVVLERRWEAPVGLTAWFSVILPLDGQIYVASLGESFVAEDDAADGVVRVSGADGRAELLFRPSERGRRDVVGLAAAGGRLYIACRNGVLYCTDDAGGLLWKTAVGAEWISPPLLLPAARGDAALVIGVASPGTVVAYSAGTGRTVWTTPLKSGRASGRDTGDLRTSATLTLAEVFGPRSSELLVTLSDGTIAVLTAATGSPRWTSQHSAGSIAGFAGCGANREACPPAWLGDSRAGLWSLATAGRTLELLPYGFAAVRADQNLIAAPRTLASGAAATPSLVVCPTSGYREQHASVCVLGLDGVIWRHPIGGAVWGTPAIADLNADASPEIIVAAIEPGAGGAARGALYVLTLQGQCVARVELPAAAECPPVVADVDGDARLEVLVADQSGMLHCFGTRGFGPVEWGLANGDSHNTRHATNAYAFGQAPFGYQRDWRPAP
ncbi:outer membrane biogenesis protein BamB [Phycisphaerae bacterium RAS1]|nr:outer membrane biogenesis protein BamB [Phycisphaerae bacterium RAS1]